MDVDRLRLLFETELDLAFGRHRAAIEPEVELVGDVTEVGGVIPVEAPDKPAIVHAGSCIEDLDVSYLHN